MKRSKVMTFPDNIPTFAMSPHRVSSESDAIDVRHQFPMINEPFDQHSALDQPPSFKRARISETYPSRMNQPQNQPLKGTSHLFFKTRLCAKFKTGNCRNGENCNFAHGLDDMREPPPNWQAIVGAHVDQSTGNWDEDQKIIHRMKICKKYYNGEECPYGDNCNFLHEDPCKFREDSGNFRESAAISIGTIGSPPKSYGDGSNGLEGNRVVNFGLNAFRGNVKPVFWKTKLCTKWETTGQCNFREDCHFAHGIAELQVPGGGRIEAETPCVVPTMPKAVIPTMPKALPVSANEAPVATTTTTCTASMPPANEEGKVKKNRLLRWDGSKKINCIYGDWIDDLPIVAHGKKSGSLS